MVMNAIHGFCAQWRISVMKIISCDTTAELALCQLQDTCQESSDSLSHTDRQRK